MFTGIVEQTGSLVSLKVKQAVPAASQSKPPASQVFCAKAIRLPSPACASLHWM